MKIEDNSKEMEYNKALNTRLRELCNELGLSIDNLTQLEEELQIYSGVADFSTARVTADGLYHIFPSLASETQKKHRFQQKKPYIFFQLLSLLNIPKIPPKKSKKRCHFQKQGDFPHIPF